LNRSGAISVYLTGMIFGARVMSTQLIERLFHFRTKPRYKKIKADPRRGDAMTDDPLPQPADLFHCDGRGRSINFEHLAHKASLEEVSDYLLSFDSYARAQAMAMIMMFSCAKRCVQIFLDWGNMCDAPWPHRSHLADALRRALAEATLIELLEAAKRTFYVGLPDFVPVWRGCERGRERGLSWTTDRAIAEGFCAG
jgi:hypothetical protein